MIHFSFLIDCTASLCRRQAKMRRDKQSPAFSPLLFVLGQGYQHKSRVLGKLNPSAKLQQLLSLQTNLLYFRTDKHSEMKLNKKFVWALAALVVLAAVYRLIPGRPMGFAPQIAIALFGGAIIKDKKWAFVLPLLSMFLSDLIFEIIYQTGATQTPGFYSGQWFNYLLFAGITIMGFAIKKIKLTNVLGFSLLAPTAYFLVSNLGVWIGNGGFGRPKTLSGLMQCYADGLPFYQGSLAATVIFCGVLFGGYVWLTRKAGSSIRA
jgi:hypothetical protein